MCLSSSNIRSSTQWNWDGDLIVHNTIIPAARRIPGTRKKYEIDIREYLANRDNAVIKRALDEMVDALSDSDRAFFFSHRVGAFDFRMRKVTEYISQRAKYKKGSRTFDSWLFPEETLALEGGDCEDRAFLLASLLLSSGISGYAVRVALGRLYNQNIRESRDHVWVMYKNELGIWMLIEPLVHTEQARKQGKALREKAGRAATDTYEYVPYYVFNDSHLWSLKNNTLDTTFLDYLRSRLFISIPYYLRHRADFPERTCLPHHNNIAVDRDIDTAGNIPDGHKLYIDPKTYSAQFNLRIDAAVNHIKQLYSIWSK